MLLGVRKIHPNTLIAWTTDRLGRDKYVLAMAKKTIRSTRREMRLPTEGISTDITEKILFEKPMGAPAEYCGQTCLRIYAELIWPMHTRSSTVVRHSDSK